MTKRKSNSEAKSDMKKKTTSKKQGTDIVPFSPKSFEGMLTGMFEGGKRRAIDVAQEVIYDAWEAPTKKRRIALARKALEISPDCADAYLILAETEAASIEDVINLYRQGLEAGERAIGKKAFKNDVGHFWGLLETRPYMRARAGLAECLRAEGKPEEAVEHYWDMLRLNPNDNQGIRDLLMPCLIELGRDKDAEKLFKQYKEDGMAVWIYSRALLDFRKHGDSAISDRSLKKALEENRHVPDYLLGRKKMPRYIPDYYGFGDENEAVLYAYGNRGAWKVTPGAMEWLAVKI
jgi:tetratricopeptide (TPR) repeat protein